MKFTTIVLSMVMLAVFVVSRNDAPKKVAKKPKAKITKKGRETEEQIVLCWMLPEASCKISNACTWGKTCTDKK